MHKLFTYTWLLTCVQNNLTQPFEKGPVALRVFPSLPNLAKDRVVTWRGVSDKNIVKSAHSPYVSQPGGVGRRGIVGTILRRIKVVTDQTLDTVIIADIFTV